MYSFHFVNTIFHMHGLLLILFLVNLSKISGHLPFPSCYQLLLWIPEHLKAACVFHCYIITATFLKYKSLLKFFKNLLLQLVKEPCTLHQF